MLNMIFLACLILTVLPGEAARNCIGRQAKYNLDFVATWSSKTHPGTGFPTNGHFSPVIGASHNSSYNMWAPGVLASPGVQSVAETGKRTTLKRELAEEMSKKTVLKLIKGPSGTLSSPGNLTVHEVIVNDHYPLVSVITMIAPSPDWIVGVHDLNLCDGQSFKDRVSHDLFVYDSGTDNGTKFDSPNSVTSPPAKIFRITKDMDTPFKGNATIPALGFMVFTKIEENKTAAPTTMLHSSTQPMTETESTPTAMPTQSPTEPMAGNYSTPTAMPTSPTEPMAGKHTTPKSKAANRFTADVAFTFLLLLLLAFLFQ